MKGLADCPGWAASRSCMVPVVTCPPVTTKNRAHSSLRVGLMLDSQCPGQNLLTHPLCMSYGLPTCPVSCTPPVCTTSDAALPCLQIMELTL